MADKFILFAGICNQPKLVFDGRLPLKDNHWGQLFPTASYDYCEAHFLMARCSNVDAAGSFAVDNPVHWDVEGQQHLIDVDLSLLRLNFFVWSLTNAWNAAIFSK